MSTYFKTYKSDGARTVFHEISNGSHAQPRLRDGRVVKENIGCCQSLNWNDITELRYISPLPAAITDQHVAFWLRFIRKMLVDEGIKWKGVLTQSTEMYGYEGQGPIRCIEWTLSGFTASRAKNLLYLCACRYPEESSDMVLSLFNRRAEANTPDDLFKLFQTIHARLYRNTDRTLWKPHNGYGGTSGQTPVSLGRFLANLERGAQTVAAHFA